MDVLVGGGRDVRGTLDGDGDDGRACVVACPPHPQHRGSRTDERLRAVSDGLTARAVDCLRIDYGPWAEGAGEVRDAVAAVAHCREELGYDRVGLFGYSFGGAVALLAAARLGPGPESESDSENETGVAAVSTLAPARRLSADLDAVTAVGSLVIPLQVVYGARDTTVEWESVVEAVRDHGGEVVELSADHLFVGQAGTASEHAAAFLTRAFG
jgi:hypothetical protein